MHVHRIVTGFLWFGLLYIGGDASQGTCETDWISIPDSGSCIQLFKHPPNSWTGARNFCQKKGGDLLKIQDSKMNTYVADKVPSRFTYTIGIRRKNNQFFWLDETSKANYVKTPPYPPGDTDDCGSLAHDGNWYFNSCSQPLAYICEKPKAAMPNPNEKHSVGDTSRQPTPKQKTPTNKLGRKAVEKVIKNRMANDNKPNIAIARSTAYPPSAANTLSESYAQIQLFYWLIFGLFAL
ncbi:asialoglycoprotein receptor 2 [Elysia marginata]|uniref:Asialoglycoprotein receptor 2 n=1 Tax=Elysia marginata TaxID=1093978 RepID=A0AAV4G379_9GAST|nr:asialoglycoprotein receptor 2 [Elysia marginata]